MGKAEALAKNRGCLDGSPILSRQEIRSCQNDTLNGGRKPAIGQISSAAEQLLQEERVAAGAFDALVGECGNVDEAPRDRPSVGGR